MDTKNLTTAEMMRAHEAEIARSLGAEHVALFRKKFNEILNGEFGITAHAAAAKAHAAVKKAAAPKWGRSPADQGRRRTSYVVDDELTEAESRKLQRLTNALHDARALDQEHRRAESPATRDAAAAIDQFLLGIRNRKKRKGGGDGSKYKGKKLVLGRVV